jgi:2-dehydropantoate 2-reductase
MHKPQGRIAIVGVGAIGGSIAAYLSRAGHNVAVIDHWAGHVERMKAEGLTLRDAEGSFTAPVTAFHVGEVSAILMSFDMVFLCVKSYDTVWCTHLIAPKLSPSGIILPTQNGINDELVGEVVGFARVVGLVPAISAYLTKPGYIVRSDPMNYNTFTAGELHGLVTRRVEEVVAILEAVPPGAKTTTNIWAARWMKLAYNCMQNPLSSLMAGRRSEMTPDMRETEALIRLAIRAEVYRVADTLGVSMGPSMTGVPAEDLIGAVRLSDLKELQARIDAGTRKKQAGPKAAQGKPKRDEELTAAAKTSFHQDVIKGRRTEIDGLNGYVVQKGQEVGVPTPVNQAIWELMKSVERGEREGGPQSLEWLKGFLLE